ncbi:MAG: UDP-N-acetyl-D-glucosamine dehydrogenase, partial [Candidatus Sericytochromatia bacterium]
MTTTHVLDESEVHATSRSRLLDKIAARTAVVGVVGLGYVGLPFAVEKAKVGYRVLGIDRSAERVALLNDGRNYIPDVSDLELAALVGEGQLAATADLA